ncbi:MAG: Hpt domain-containing protein [Bacteroidota bacterium]|nr:Hpt domain-containing protein [Candidatus Kapabacteria bacterium]MDW8220305.1 Hpt domain-containing protein [Bacteroidota bacterium]
MEPIQRRVSSDLEPIMPRYLANRKSDIERLRAALASNMLEDIRALGHTMKGSGTSFGIEDISTFGRAIEQAAKAADTEALRHLIEEFASFIEHLEIIFVDEST